MSNYRIGIRMLKYKYIFIVLMLSFAINTVKTKGFIEKEIIFNNGETILSGTLSIPDTIKVYPAVVLVTGSGQQTRDEEIAGFKLFRVISDSLTSKGIAVLRYDDRGIGKSKGDLKTATTYDFAQDALAGAKELTKLKYIDRNNIGILGHSEGGAIANIIASENPQLIKFIVIMAGPTISGGEIILSQIKVVNKSNGASDEQITIAVDSQKGLYKLLGENASEDKLKAYLTDVNLKAYDGMPEEKKKYVTDKEQFAKMQADMAVKKINTPWFKYFISYNPAKDIKNVKCRIIAMFGEKDTQVEATSNSQAFENIMKENKNKNYIMKIFPSANHLFQTANTGLVNEYSKLPAQFVPGFLDFIAEQILFSVK